MNTNTINKTAACFFYPPLQSFFTKETTSAAKKLVTSFLTSSDYLITVGGRRAPTLLAAEVSVRAAILGIGAYAITKLAFLGIQKILNPDDVILEPYEYNHPAPKKVALFALTGFAQLGIAIAGGFVYSQKISFTEVRGKKSFSLLAIKHGSVNAAFLGISAYVIAKLACIGVDSIVNQDDWFNGKRSGFDYASMESKKACLIKSIVILKGVSQIGTACSLGFIVYDSIEVHRTIISIFLSQAWRK